MSAASLRARAAFCSPSAAITWNTYKRARVGESSLTICHCWRARDVLICFCPLSGYAKCFSHFQRHGLLLDFNFESTSYDIWPHDVTLRPLKLWAYRYKMRYGIVYVTVNKGTWFCLTALVHHDPPPRTRAEKSHCQDLEYSTYTVATFNCFEINAILKLWQTWLLRT